MKAARLHDGRSDFVVEDVKRWAPDLSALRAYIFPLSDINRGLAHNVAQAGGLRHVCLDCRT